MINGNLAYKDEYFSHSPKKNTGVSYGTYTGMSSSRSSAHQTRNQYMKKTKSHMGIARNERKQVVRKSVYAEKNINTTEKEKREMINRKAMLLRIVYMLIIAFSASFMISKYVAVNETANEIRALSRELENTRAYTSQRVYEMERNIDLSEVEEIATAELGMQRPESYQIIYVNVDKDDISEVTAKEVEGAGNDLKALFHTIKENIIELFSIN